MQEKTRPVYIVATSNDISCLPPEFLRKGRFDEIFSVDFPTQEERKEIFKIHLPKNIKEDRNELASKLSTQNSEKKFTGADIENMINEAMEIAFTSEPPKDEISKEDLLELMKRTSSTYQLQKDKLDKMKKQLNELGAKSVSKGEK
jgi:SpoVK/Ycf46/Vps4 family AAA+-type ATPase